MSTLISITLLFMVLRGSGKKNGTAHRLNRVEQLVVVVVSAAAFILLLVGLCFFALRVRSLNVAYTKIEKEWHIKRLADFIQI